MNTLQHLHMLLFSIDAFSSADHLQRNTNLCFFYHSSQCPEPRACPAPDRGLRARARGRNHHQCLFTRAF